MTEHCENPVDVTLKPVFFIEEKFKSIMSWLLRKPGSSPWGLTRAFSLFILLNDLAQL